jgi:sugar phosphate isomerase/epimerase
MNRRKFIETSLATAALTSLPGRALAAQHEIKKVGMQLYTVRTVIKTDFDGTIAKVAAIGYKEVEFAGYFNHSPKDIRAILDKNELAAPSCHASYKVVEKSLSEQIDAAHIIGHQFIVCPGIEEVQRKGPDGYKRATDLFNKAGETTKKAGIQFAYHAHYWEFEPDANLGGKFPYDYMLENSDANNLKMELDLGWINVAGQDPIAYFNKYPGRFPLVHVKDFTKLPNVPPDKLADLKMDDIKSNMTSAGSGIIDWKRIFASADKAGIQHYFVEHDDPKDPFASLTASYAYLSKLRF